MDYEKAYKEALKRAKESLNDGTISQNTIDYLHDIFPELKESRDEKVRKALIKQFNSLNTIVNWGGIKREDILAWLEKQGEQKPFNNDIVETIKKKIIDHFDNHLLLDRCFSIGGLKNDILRIINEVKQGEQKTVSQKEIDDAYLKGISDAKAELEKQKPIEMKSAEESLGIDSETYNKIVDDCIFGEQSRCEDCSIKTTNCQKSPCVLRDGIKKPVEWSEEDDIHLDWAIRACQNMLEYYENSTGQYKDSITWLKSLKERTQKGG